jgi:uncharacterized metal-binding protein YceD (DUF177 family)
MPLTFNMRHLDAKEELHLEGELPAAELELDMHDEVIHPANVLYYDLTAERLEGGVLVQGEIDLEVEYECVRCLKRFSQPLDLEHWTCHLPLTGEDAVEVQNDLVNLTPYLREDILLALPQHPLCEAECEGVKVPDSVKEPSVPPEKAPSAWDELDKLKLK